MAGLMLALDYNERVRGCVSIDKGDVKLMPNSGNTNTAITTTAAHVGGVSIPQERPREFCDKLLITC